VKGYPQPAPVFAIRSGRRRLKIYVAQSVPVRKTIPSALSGRSGKLVRGRVGAWSGAMSDDTKAIEAKAIQEVAKDDRQSN